MSAESVAQGNRRRVGILLGVVGLVSVIVSTANGIPHELTRQQINFLETEGKQVHGQIMAGSDQVTEERKVLSGQVVSTTHDAHIDVDFTTLNGRLIRGSLDIPFETFERFRLKSVAGDPLAVTVMYDASDPMSFTTRETSVAQHDAAMWRSLFYLGLCNLASAAALFGGIALWRSSRSKELVPRSPTATRLVAHSGQADVVSPVQPVGAIELPPWERRRESKPS
jgi:hypothetical protein